MKSHGPTDTPLIERAYQLADSGGFSSASEIVEQLRKEDYEDADTHLDGAAIRASLNRRCHQARSDGMRSANPTNKLRAMVKAGKRREARKAAAKRALKEDAKQ